LEASLIVKRPKLLATARCLYFVLYAIALAYFSGGSSDVDDAPPIYPVLGGAAFLAAATLASS
jgi:hypothetical protein